MSRKVENLRQRQKHPVDFNDLMMYRSAEWVGLFKDKKTVPADVIQERRERIVIELTLDGVAEYRGKVALAYRDLYFPQEKEPAINVTKFKGTTVSTGKVKGSVRVIFSPRNVSGMKKGEILVAPMTSPDYIVAMRMASAIVTDIGGLMSHAAIISRELKVPCIVGTKIATKVLKDGDLVEVDADSGIVKIIKRAEK